jgi:hypothetical protein
VKICFVLALRFLLAAPVFSASAAAGDTPRQLLMKHLAAEPPAAPLFTPLLGSSPGLCGVKVAEAEAAWLGGLK